MRPRHALTLLALVLPLPVVVTALPEPSPAAAPTPLREQAALSQPTLVLPSPPPQATRRVPERVASRRGRVVPPRSRPVPTTLHPHRAPTRRPVAPAPTHRPAPSSSGYPWATDTSGGRDTWGFTERQCVSYVAWQLSRAGRPVWSRDGWGSASAWDDVARRRGVAVTSSPSVGSVAQWKAGERSTAYVSGSPRGSFSAGAYGHVAWVTKVYSDGSVQVSQYNGDGSRRLSSMRVRAPRFLRL